MSQWCLGRSDRGEDHWRGVGRRKAGLERSKSALAVMLDLMRAMMVTGALTGETVTDGRAWRDGEYATFWRGHPPGRNEHTQEQRGRKHRDYVKLRPTSHRPPHMWE